MTSRVESKRPPLDLVLSLLSTKTPDSTDYPRRNDNPSALAYGLPASLPATDEDKRHFRTRFYGVLDVLAKAILTEPKQVSAVAASLAPPLPGSSASIHTTLYIALNPGIGLPTAEQIETRVRTIIKDLKKYSDGIMESQSSSPEFIHEPCSFVRSFYAYGRERFRHYYNKREPRLKQAMLLFNRFKVEHAGTCEPKDLEHLDATLLWLERLGLLFRLSDWTRVVVPAVGREIDRFTELLHEGDLAPSGLFQTYYHFEVYLKSKDNFIPIIRWINKLCSFHLSARKLLSLATSARFRGVLFGDLDIEVYHQDWSDSKRQEIECNDAILLETVAYLRGKFDSSSREDPTVDRKTVKRLKGDLEKERDRYLNPRRSVHCEVFLLRRVQTAGIAILPYIGVSKLSCVPCSVYFEHLADAGFDSVSTRGSHGKIYPGWTFLVPTTASGDAEDKRMEELHDRVKARLEDLLWRYIDEIRNPRSSDSTVGSVEKGKTFMEDPGMEDFLRQLDREELAVLGISTHI
ncbi:hypothetical protein CC1G_10109 [Coprinopsis cinerea okayama7|uniref:Uncharacterized protein n=1 Tax=Coprinopsis cinerea (strain Okayama-7 / 130 / ATCC MYA-4618 / FGSC 9003) TaxID=240176 RepID=A8N406_COPC7|nr:hypothetical protein CC1G_10109 [Coprinopsis cinerea okayama7\|eukprot:XP_001829579.2 hypothetical protein CC1G_10109 [Coprinopsis cinerea okayama7\